MRKMKKTLAILLATIFVTGSLAGCSGTKKNSDGEVAGKKNIEISYWNAGMGSVWLDNLIEAFEEKYPDYHVYYNASAAGESYKAAFGTEEADTVDLYLGTYLGQTEYLEPLNDVLDTTIEGESKSIREKFHADYLALEENDGKYYTLSMGGGIMGIVYNKEMFDEAGITQLPRTTNELALVASTFTDNGIPAFCHFKTKGYWNWITEVWTSQYEGYDYYLNTLYKNPSKDVLLKKDGRYETIKVLEKLITPESTLQGSNTASHIEIQTRFLQGKCAMMVNGSWLVNEMPDTEKIDNFFMMKTPVISSVIDKLTTINSESVLRNVITAIDNVTDGTESIDTYKSGDDYTVNGTTVSAADWNHVKSARNSFSSSYNGNVASIPTYSDNIEGAKLFLQFLYSDEGLKIYTDTTHVTLPIDLDHTTIDTSEWNAFEKNQVELFEHMELNVNQDIKSRHKIYEGGASTFTSFNYIAPLCTNSEADKMDADEIWAKITAIIDADYGDWEANIK